MFREFLFLQWKTSRWGIFLLALVGFALPLLILRSAHAVSLNAYAGRADVLQTAAMWMPLFPLFAAGVGMTAALTAWSWDHKTNHVYALSLPLSRRQYVLMKLSAGLVALVVPVLTLLLGSLIALATIELPEGISAYPFAFAIRFLLACLIVYTIVFALAAGTIRTTVILLIALLLVVVGGSIVTGYLSDLFNTTLTSPLDLLVDAMLTWPGPFNVFGGNWMLIDV